MRKKKINKQVEKAVIDLKIKHPRLSCRRIADGLRAQGIEISKSMVNEILKKVQMSKRPKKVSVHTAKLEYLSSKFLPLRLFLYMIVDELLLLSEFWSKRLLKELPGDIARILILSSWASQVVHTSVLHLVKLGALKSIYRYNVKEALKYLDKATELAEISIYDLQDFINDIVQVGHYRITLPLKENMQVFVDTGLKSVFTSMQSLPKQSFLLNRGKFMRELLAHFILLTLNGFGYPSPGSFHLVRALIRKDPMHLEVINIDGKEGQKISFEPKYFIVGFSLISMKKGVEITESGEETVLSYSYPRKKITARKVSIKLSSPKEPEPVEAGGAILKIPGKQEEWLIITDMEDKTEAARIYLEVYPDFWTSYQEFLEETSNMLLRKTNVMETKPFLVDLSLKKADEFIKDTIEKAMAFYVPEKIPDTVMHKPVKFSVRKDRCQITLPEECRLFPATVRFLKELKYPVLGEKFIMVRERGSRSVRSGLEP